MEQTQQLEEKQGPSTGLRTGKYERFQARQQERQQLQKQHGRKKLFRRMFIWLGVAVFVAGSLYGLIQAASRTSIPNQSATSLTVPVSEADWRKGNPDAKVILVEYSDFQCPACGAYWPMLEQVNKELGDKVQFVYRHYPLRQIHANADLAARVSEAAGRQGKFWEMHDLLFKNQATWSKANAKGEFDKYAEELGLNLEQFKKDIDDQALKDKINAQIADGNESGVSATPTFFINGKKIQNPASYEQFKSIITAVAGPAVTP